MSELHILEHSKVQFGDTKITRRVFEKSANTDCATRIRSVCQSLARQRLSDGSAKAAGKKRKRKEEGRKREGDRQQQILMSPFHEKMSCF